MAVDFTKLNRSAYYVTWNNSISTLDFGLCDAIKVDLKIVADPIRVATTGKAILGKRVIGIEGTIKVGLRQLTEAFLNALCPWNGGGIPSGGIVLTPPANTDLYIYAGALRLHPTTQGDNTMDLVLSHAACISIAAADRDNQKDDVIMVEFEPYPDRSQISSTAATTLSYGTAGGN